MKAVEKNISRHANGTLYFVSRRNGHLIRTSLGTKKLEEARRAISRMLADRVVVSMTAREPQAVPLPEGLSLTPVPATAPVPPAQAVIVTPAVTPPTISLAEAMEEFRLTQAFANKGTREMFATAKSAIIKNCTGWDSFAPAKVWQDYRVSGISKTGQEYGSASNQVRWFLRKFVPWAVSKGFLPPSMEEELKGIPLVKVNPRRVRIPPMGLVEEFLQMVSSEDEEAGVFLRFLTCTGLRLTAANQMKWKNFDLRVPQMVVKQKGGRECVIPMTAEAVEVLESRKGLGHKMPFGFDQPALDRIERRMKKFAAGLELDLTYYHSFRHYFASVCLMSGMSVQEVAKLLGHSDNGELVLRTYGHICGDHLRLAVSRLRLAKAA